MEKREIIIAKLEGAIYGVILTTVLFILFI